jgi:hypothetical protein
MAELHQIHPDDPRYWGMNSFYLSKDFSDDCINQILKHQCACLVTFVELFSPLVHDKNGWHLAKEYFHWTPEEEEEWNTIKYVKI